MKLIPFVIVFLVIMIGCKTEQPDARPNILLVLLDTVRADHLHCYGYERTTSPVIDSLAAEGTIWMQVQGQSSWTLPAMASIFTGTSERSHRAGLRDGHAFGLSEELETIPVLLKDEGYTTSAFFNVPVMAPSYGFTRGFDFTDCRGCSVETLKAEEVVDSFIDYMDHQNIHDDSPFFIVLHLFDPHSPYEPPEPFASLWADQSYNGTRWGSKTTAEIITGFSSGEMDSAGLQNMIDLYDGEIAYTDNQLRRVFNYFEDRGIIDNTLVILVADHGEEFGEHGEVLHGFQLYQETTRVPLIISGPNISSGNVEYTVVGQMDILPTLLAYLEIPIPGQVEGRNIIGVPDTTPPVLLPASGFITPRDEVVVRRGPVKVFWSVSTDQAVQYDIDSDIGEMNPVSADTSMREEARIYFSTPPLVDAPVVPGQEMLSKKLRDLGYL